MIKCDLTFFLKILKENGIFINIVKMLNLIQVRIELFKPWPKSNLNWVWVEKTWTKPNTSIGNDYSNSPKWVEFGLNPTKLHPILHIYL